MKHSILCGIRGATLAQTIPAAVLQKRLTMIFKGEMATSDMRESVLLEALGDGGWRCEGTRQLGVPLDGVAGGEGTGSGLRLYWTERAMCSLSWGNGHEVLLAPGSLVALPRGLPHRLRSCGNAGLAWAMTSVWASSPWCASLLLSDQAVLNDANPWPCAPESICSMRARIAGSGAAPGPAESAMLERCARDVARLALCLAERSPAQSPLGAALSHARLGPWLREMLLATGSLPDIDTCAARCNLSRAAFTRRIADLTGASYVDFATRWRMNLALHRLVLAGESVADLCARSGYESEASFRKAFRRATGVTPGAARVASSIDAALGVTPACPPAMPHTQRPSPAKVAVSTHAAPPDLASLLTGIISRL